MAPHLKGGYQERSDPPFDNFYVDHAVYFRALQGKDVDAAIAHFRAKVERADPEADPGTAPAQVLVGLLVRLDRYAEAVEVSRRRVCPMSRRQNSPVLPGSQLCFPCR